MQSVEEPVKIGVGIGKGSSGEHAVRWVLQNQILPSNTIHLIHVYPPLRLIPTPMGNKVPISEVNEVIVKKFQEERFMETEKLVNKYRIICQKKEVKAEVHYVVGDSIQQNLVDQVFKLGLAKLVLGTSSNSIFSRAFKGETIPKFVAKHTPEFCTVLVVCKGKLCSVKMATECLIPAPSSDIDTASSEGIADGSGGAVVTNFEISRSNFPLHSSSFQDPQILSASSQQKPHASSLIRAQTIPVQPRIRNDSENYGEPYSRNPIHHRQPWMSREDANERPADFIADIVSFSPQSLPISLSAGSDTPTSVRRDSFVHNYSNLEEGAEDMPRGSAILLQNQLEDAKVSIFRSQIVEKDWERDQDFRDAEMGRHRSLENVQKREEALAQLRTSLKDEQDRIQKDLAEDMARSRETQQKMDEYKSRLEEANRRAEEERERCKEAMRRLAGALEELEVETRLRKEAERRALKESAARQGAMASLRKLQNKYTIYSFEDLAKATDDFSERNKLGEGGYGPVYKGELQHTTVAIKILAQEGARGRQEFEREVELLSTLHHPHMVMLLGACPEKACIVYEYMPHGSLQDRLQRKGGSPPLPWYIRFRICAEVAIALLFLHSRPEPIVHRDLKPGNILLDSNYVSKISDVGIAKISDVCTTYSATLYKETHLVGTMAYMDPDYQRTGVVSRESDVFALGIIMLQLLTGKPAFGVVEMVERAISADNLYAVLDKSAGNWPLEGAASLASLALECAEPRRRHRPKLESKVLPVLEILRDSAAQAQLAAVKSAFHGSEIIVPGFLFCPISQEIMQNPHIAADGYTYDYEAITVWLRNHDTSPMTNLQLEHKNLIPNHAVHSAIKDWLDRSMIK